MLATGSGNIKKWAVPLSFCPRLLVVLLFQALAGSLSSRRGFFIVDSLAM